MSVRQGVNTIAGAVGKYPLNERNITNCITEIPQDIKLELNNGTLTLKAGSKVYVPNGAGVFDEVAISNDINLNTSSGSTANRIVFYKNDGTLYSLDKGQIFSGATQPTVSAPTNLWYDTTNNVIKRTTDTGSTWTNYGLSLPLCIAPSTNGVGFTSIDQVFNGFGYIDRTKFVLPGVKGLVPDGFNADGTLKNIEVTTSSVFSRTSSSTTEGVKCFFNSSAMENYPTNRIVYDSSINKNIDSNDNSVLNMLHCSHLFDQTAGSVTGGLRFYNSFRAVDYNDTEYMANQAMPSNRSINLTLGTSGSTYTAPADGYFVAYSVNTGNLALYNTTANLGNSSPIISQIGSFVSCPARKGESVMIVYTGSGISLKFVYAQGAR